MPSRRHLKLCAARTSIGWILAGLLFAASAVAQPSTSNSWVLSQATLSGAGNTSTSTSYLLDGTLSQAATVGDSSSTSFVLESGFWTSASITRSLTVLGGGSGQGTMTGNLINCTTDGGTTSGDCDETSVHGTTLEVVASPGPTSTFDGWSGCTSTSTTTLPGDTCTAVLSADRVVTATFTSLGSAAALIWQDIDGNGVQDAGEPGLDGVMIDLTGPSGPLQTVTAGGGLYSFPDLYPGSYTATVDTSTLPAGHFPTFDLDGVGTPDSADFTVLDGQASVDIDFGYQPRIDLVITKDDDADPLPGGDSLTYTITVENLGPAAASDIVVTDVLPTGLTLIATSGCAEDPAAVPTCTLGDLAVGAMVSYTIEASIDPMPQASITNTASVAATEFDLVTGNDSDSETTTLDASPPTVTVVNSDAATADDELVDCETVNDLAIYRLTVRFDDSMDDPAGDSAAGDVTNPESWLLVQPGPDASFNTNGCSGPSGDDLQVTPSSITYDDGTNTATLQLASRLEGLYRLFACGTGSSVLRDRAGNFLDGNADGTGGDDFLRFFRADPLNALADGHFDCSLGAWVPISTNPLEITHSSDDADGSADSGSAAVTNLTMSSEFSLGQCIEAAGMTEYLLSAQLRLSSENPGVFVRLSCEFFDGLGCTGVSLEDPQGFASLVADTAGQWITPSTTLTTPDGTASALCAAEFVSEVDQDFDARVDQIMLLDASLIFSDGFEAANTQVWSSTVP